MIDTAGCNNSTGKYVRRVVQQQVANNRICAKHEMLFFKNTSIVL